MSDPKHDLYDAYGQLPFAMRQALDVYTSRVDHRGAVSCLEDQARGRRNERPYDEARKKEYEAACEGAARSLGAMIQARDKLARAILAALAEAKR